MSSLIFSCPSALNPLPFFCALEDWGAIMIVQISDPPLEVPRGQLAFSLGLKERIQKESWKELLSSFSSSLFSYILERIGGFLVPFVYKPLAFSWAAGSFTKDLFIRKSASRSQLAFPLATTSFLGVAFSLFALGASALGGTLLYSKTTLPFAPNVAAFLEETATLETALPEYRPREGVIEYTVAPGDSLSSIGFSFGVSVDSLRYENDLFFNEGLSPGQVLKIPPISGITYTVKSGDTLERIAKKFGADSTAILEFNYLFSTALTPGQELLIPDAKVFIYEGSFPSAGGVVSGSGIFSWPVLGTISRYFSSYHLGLDIAGSSPVIASDGGTVITAGGYFKENYCGFDYDSGLDGFGLRVAIDHGNGYQTVYAHLNNIFVEAGQSVVKGQEIGQTGQTGCASGVHLHFTVKQNGIPVDPLSVL